MRWRTFMFGRWIVVAVMACGFGSAVAAPADDRFAEAQRKLAEKQRLANEAKARAATQPATFPVGQDLPPATQPAGAKKSARVVFVIDASGSMISKMEEAVDDVAKAIGNLRPDQSFNVIAAFDGKKMMQLDREMLPASPENHAKAYAFLTHLSTTGTDATIVGIQAAAKLRPDVVWLVTDGDFSSGAEGTAAVQKACIALHARVNTSLKYGGGNEDEFLVGVAAATGGICVDREGGRVAPKKNEPLPPPPKGKSILQE